MSEKISLKFCVNGEQLDEIAMGEGRTGSIYPDDLVFYKSGHVIVGGSIEYHYNIRVERPKKEGE